MEKEQNFTKRNIQEINSWPIPCFCAKPVEHLLEDYFLSAGCCYACSHRSQCTGTARGTEGC